MNNFYNQGNNQQPNMFDSSIMDVEEDLNNTDIKINPSYYLHRGITKAQDALMMNDIREGMFRYRMIVDNLKIIAMSAKMIDVVEFEKKMEENKKKIKESKPELHIELFHIANAEMGIILEEVFGNKVITSPVKV